MGNAEYVGSIGSSGRALRCPRTVDKQGKKEFEVVRLCDPLSGFPAEADKLKPYNIRPCSRAAYACFDSHLRGVSAYYWVIERTRHSIQSRTAQSLLAYSAACA